VRNAIADTAQLCRELGHTIEEAKPSLDQVRLNDAARRVRAIEVAKTIDAIAKANGIIKLDDAFESRALGLLVGRSSSAPPIWYHRLHVG
jgi:hypothetical protein